MHREGTICNAHGGLSIYSVTSVYGHPGNTVTPHYGHQMISTVSPANPVTSLFRNTVGNPVQNVEIARRLTPHLELVTAGKPKFGGCSGKQPWMAAVPSKAISV